VDDLDLGGIELWRCIMHQYWSHTIASCSEA
jgi:hypothetical protein